MTSTAVFFLILSAVVIWGGLLASIARLRHDGRHGQYEDAAPDVATDVQADVEADIGAGGGAAGPDAGGRDADLGQG